MATVAELRAFHSALEAARFAGLRSVENAGRKVEYKTDAEMRQALADLDRQIAAAEGRRPVSQVRIIGSKGI